MTARPGRRWNGFTLVEIVVALTVVALLTAVSLPSIQGVIREHEAQEPLRELAALARRVRQEAIQRQRPFFIGFDERGCFAAAFYQSYDNVSTYESLRQRAQVFAAQRELLEAGAARFGGDLSGVETEDAAFLERYEWPEGMKVRVRLWGDPSWETLDGARFRQWIFQPTGLVRPLWVQWENDGVFLEAKFASLTAEIEEERSYVP